MIEQVKVYGERNTGTSFARALIKNNFVVEMLSGNVIGERTFDERPSVSKGLSEEGWLIKAIVHDRMNTLANDKILPDTLGWKHMSPPIELLQSMPERTKNTLFVVTVKHPVFWMLSFHRHPYHSYFRNDEMTFGDFIRKIFIPSGRDNVDAAVYESAIELYAAKVDGYRRLSELGLHFELVRYEELVQDIPAFLARIGDKFNLARRRARLVVRERSTKGDDTSLADFQERYRLENVRNAVSPDEYQFIMARFGRERLAWLGYPEG